MENIERKLAALALVFESQARLQRDPDKLKTLHEEVNNLMEARYSETQLNAMVAVMGGPLEFACMQVDAMLHFFDKGPEFVMQVVVGTVEKIRERKEAKKEPIH